MRPDVVGSIGCIDQAERLDGLMNRQFLQCSVIRAVINFTWAVTDSNCTTWFSHSLVRHGVRHMICWTILLTRRPEPLPLLTPLHAANATHGGG